MTFSAADWTVLTVYFLGTLSLGVLFARKSSSVEGYTAAGRSLPGWVCGLSIFATYLSSISYLALPGKSFAANWNPFVMSLAIPVAALVAVRFFVPYYRSSGSVSAYAALESRFGTWARLGVSVFYLLTQIARIAVVMYLMALPMQMLLGWDMYALIILTGIVVTLYSMIGGVTAVIWADAIQAVVLMVGAVACFVTMIALLPGDFVSGLSQVIGTGTDAGKFSLGSTSLTDFSEPTILVVLLFSLSENLKNFGIDQSYIQRYIASDSDAAARRSVWIGALLYVPVSALFFLIGTTLFVFYQADVGQADVAGLDEVRRLVASQQLDADATDAAIAERAGTLSDAKIGDRVFPYFIVTQMPTGLRGLLIAAVFAAAMSTVSTSLNSSATLVLEDYVRRFTRRDLSESAAMLVLRGATMLWGIIGTALAVVLIRFTNSALDMWWTLSAVLAGAMVGIFLLGIFTAVRSWPALVASLLYLAIGFGVVGVFSYAAWAAAASPPVELPAAAASLTDWLGRFHPFLGGAAGAALIIVVALVLDPLLKRTDP